MKKIFYSISVLAILSLNSFVTNVAAQAHPGAPLPPPPSLIQLLTQMLPMFGIVFFIFFFLVIKPQQKKTQEQEQLIKDLKKGDSVITTSGIIGRVVLIEPSSVTLEISPNVKVKFLPSVINKKEEVKA